METFRFWLEDDQEIPWFKRFRFKKAQVPLADVLTKGVHPWQGPDAHRSLPEKFVNVLNSDEFKLPEIEQFDHCRDFHYSTCGSSYYQTSAFEDVLSRISKGIYFVKEISYAELLELAKERLRKTWSHTVARELLDRAHNDFDSMRTFLKAKGKGIKLSGYADIEKYDLGKVLCLGDFETEDRILIRQGIPLDNFRSVDFLDHVTDERGLLRLVDEIKDFQIILGKDRSYRGNSLVFNCRRKGETVRFRPGLEKKYDKRQTVLEFACRWRIDDGRYCFTTNIARVSEMISDNCVGISFPSLDYMNQREADVSNASISESKVERHSVGKILNGNTSCRDLREVLRNHGVSMTGRKEELLEKLARLSAKVFNQKKEELDAYFGKRRFIHVPSDHGGLKSRFPLLEGLDIQNMVLAMYIIKHLRGNAILDAKHENDSFDLLALARALIRKEVSIDGTFVKVE